METGVRSGEGREEGKGSVEAEYGFFWMKKNMDGIKYTEETMNREFMENGVP